LNDRAGRGRKPWLPQTAVQQVVEHAVTPPPHLGRWSCRTMARAAGISPASVQRLWAASEIKPRLSRTFKLSTDKRFEEKFRDVIGLYLNLSHAKAPSPSPLHPALYCGSFVGPADNPLPQRFTPRSREVSVMLPCQHALGRL
jgi:hypothetical protein